MSIRGQSNPAFIHTLDDVDGLVVKVTKTTDPQNGAVDVVVEKDTYVDGKIESLEVDRKHVTGKKGHIEIETSHVEAGNGRLTIDKTLKDVTKGHIEVKDIHTEVKDGHVVEIVNETDLTPTKGGKMDVGTNANVKTGTLTTGDVKGIELPVSDVKGAVVTKSDVKGAVVTKSDLKGAVVTKSDVKGAVVTKSDVKGAVVTKNDVKGAVVTKSDMKGAVVTKSDVKGAVVTKSDVKGAVVTKNDAKGVVVTKGDVKGAPVTKSNTKTVAVTKGSAKGASVTKATSGKGTTVTKRARNRTEVKGNLEAPPAYVTSSSSSSDDDELPHPNKKKKRCTCCTRGIHRMQKRVTAFVYNHSRAITLCFNIFFVLIYYAYFGYAMYYKFGDEGSIRLLCITILLTFYILYRISRVAIKKKWSCCCWLVSCFKCLKWTEEGFWRIAKFMKLKIILCVMFSLFFLVYTIVVIGLNQPTNLISAGGMAVFVGFFFILSDNPEKVRWRPVFCGISLQFVFAMMLMRTKSGAAIFLYLGQRMSEFIGYSESGAKFVFGPDYAEHFFAFKVLPVVIFFSAAVSVLYHLGLMQFVVKHLGRCLALFMSTSPVESVVAIANIFVGQTEAPVLAGPYLETMTRSELHTIMTSGFATVSGPIMAAFVLYDIPVIHLLSASVMSAPAAIGMSKLFYPETEEVLDSSNQDHVTKIKGRATNIIEAASNGAVSAIKIVANIIAHLIAFVSLLMFMNAAFVFLGHRVGLIPPDYPELTFQLVYSYFFWPFALLMGVDIGDCQKVAELIGTKMIINEFAAYHYLNGYITNKDVLTSYLDERNLTMASGYGSDWYMNRNDIILNDTQQVLTGGILSDRSTVISTYALCGFSNFSAMGIMLGVLVALVPKRKADISRVVFRAMIAGNVASFMTACMAGLLYTG